MPQDAGFQSKLARSELTVHLCNSKIVRQVGTKMSIIYLYLIYFGKHIGLRSRGQNIYFWIRKTIHDSTGTNAP